MPNTRRSTLPTLLRAGAVLAALLGIATGIFAVATLAADDGRTADPSLLAQAAAPGKIAPTKTPPVKSDAAKPATNQPATAVDDIELYKLLADTLDQVERNYVKEIDRRELIEAAVEGVLRKLDPHSNYIRPEEIERFRASVDNEFGGIGIQVTTENGYIEVTSPLVGTPAYRAGIQAGDRITHIGGQPIADVSVDEAIKRLKGPVGSAAIFSIMRPTFTEPRQITVTREVIHVETVLGDRRNADDSWNFVLDEKRQIGYIRLNAFSRDTASELQQALEGLRSNGLKSLILDLRFNPGGLLSAAIEVSDLFLAEGAIVSTQGRNTPRQSWSARKAGTFDGFPMVVLVNRYSASASEIVSAALQDHQRATIIGERTWGKGSVQNVIELEGGRSALKLTTAAYQRPNGHNIHRFPDSKETDEWGVTPNEGFLIKLPDTELTALITDRREHDVIRPKGRAANVLRAPEPAEGAELAAREIAQTSPPTNQAATTPAATNNTTTKSAATQPTTGPFTDRQLQRAVELLTSNPSLPRRP